MDWSCSKNGGTYPNKQKCGLYYSHKIGFIKYRRLVKVESLCSHNGMIFCIVIIFQVFGFFNQPENLQTRDQQLKILPENCAKKFYVLRNFVNLNGVQTHEH